MKSERSRATGRLLKAARKMLGLGQKELGAAIGVAAGTISRYETGEWDLDMGLVEKFRTLDNIPPEAAAAYNQLMDQIASHISDAALHAPHEPFGPTAIDEAKLAIALAPLLQRLAVDEQRLASALTTALAPLLKDVAVDAAELATALAPHLRPLPLDLAELAHNLSPLLHVAVDVQDFAQVLAPLLPPHQLDERELATALAPFVRAPAVDVHQLAANLAPQLQPAPLDLQELAQALAPYLTVPAPEPSQLANALAPLLAAPSVDVEALASALAPHIMALVDHAQRSSTANPKPPPSLAEDLTTLGKTVRALKRSLVGWNAKRLAMSGAIGGLTGGTMGALVTCVAVLFLAYCQTAPRASSSNGQAAANVGPGGNMASTFSVHELLGALRPQVGDNKPAEKYVSDTLLPGQKPRDQCDSRLGERPIKAGCWVGPLTYMSPPCGLLYRYEDGCYRPVAADPNVPVGETAHERERRERSSHSAGMDDATPAERRTRP